MLEFRDPLTHWNNELWEQDVQQEAGRSRVISLDYPIQLSRVSTEEIVTGSLYESPSLNLMDGTFLLS